MMGVCQFWGKGVWGIAPSAKRFKQQSNFLPNWGAWEIGPQTATHLR
jgi:hypothetical protein